MLALFVKSSITVAEFVPINGILRGFRKHENSDLGASETIKGFHPDTWLSDERIRLS